MNPNSTVSNESAYLTVRLLYTEAQNWTRHYEALLVNASVFIVTISIAFLAFAFSDKATSFERYVAIVIPMILSVLGFMLVRMLFGLYAATIERMVRFEKILGCFDPEVGLMLDGGSTLLPVSLQQVPVPEPPSARFFSLVFVIQTMTLLVLLIWRVM